MHIFIHSIMHTLKLLCVLIGDVEFLYHIL